MGRIRKKMKSSSGASIVLVLLFLLICMMTGGSVLMAAASNAGKSRSNREENQVYLAMSSALSLVLDDLMSAKYFGQYKYEVTEEQGTGESGTEDGETSGTGKKLTYTQEEGAFECELGMIVLNDLDALFAKDMEKWCKEKQAENQNISYILKGDLSMGEHTLTINSDIEELKDYPVKITISVKDSYSMEFTATMDEYPSFVMQAELTANANRPAVKESSDTVSVNQTEPMKWKLGWITTGTEESDEAS